MSAQFHTSIPASPCFYQGASRNTGGCQPLQHLCTTDGDDVRKGSELVAGRNLFKSRELARGFFGFTSSAGKPIRGPGLGREPRSSISGNALNKVQFQAAFLRQAFQLRSFSPFTTFINQYWEVWIRRVCSLTRFPRLFCCELRELSRRSAEGAVFVQPQFEADWCTQRHETMPVMRASRTDGKQKVGGKAEQRRAMLLHSVQC